MDKYYQAGLLILGMAASAAAQLPGSYGLPVLEARSSFANSFNAPTATQFTGVVINNNGSIASGGGLSGDTDEIESALFYGTSGSGLHYVGRTGTGVVNPPALGPAFFETVSLSSDDRLLVLYRFFVGIDPSWYVFDPTTDTIPQFFSTELGFQNASALSESLLTPDGSIFFSVSGSFAPDSSHVVETGQGVPTFDTIFRTRDRAFVEPGPPPIPFDAGFSPGSFNDSGQQIYTRFERLSVVNLDTFAIIERVNYNDGSPTFDQVDFTFDPNSGNPGVYSAITNGPDLNESGETVYVGSLRATPGQQELVFWDGTNTSVLLTEGTPVGQTTITEIGFLIKPKINDLGQVLFYGTDDQGTTGLWITDGTDVTAVASLGDRILVDDVNDCDGDSDTSELTRSFTITSFSNTADINNDGTVVFIASDAVNGFEVSGRGVFTVSPGAPFCLADFDQSGSLSGDDLDEFNTQFGLGDFDSTDLTDDCSLDFFDVLEAQALLEEGC